MIAFYITAHGYGHAARSLEVIEALLPHHPVTVVSLVPEPFFRSRLGDALQLRPKAFDLGLVQLDSVRGDVPATLAAYQQLMQQTEVLVQEELDFFAHTDVRLVLIDAPALPLAAARDRGIPGLALTSFGWDYIYSQFASSDPGWIDVCAWFEQNYAQATHLLRYPFSAPMPAIASQEEVPLVSGPGRNRRAHVAALSGARLDRPWALVWFHQLDLDPAQLENLPFEFFTVGSLRWPVSNCHQVSIEFSDLVASCDLVVSKPGFGILSDCVANQKPLVYVPRTDFREAQLLELSIQRHVSHARISQTDLYAGRWQQAMEEALAMPRPATTLALAGAGPIAERILSFL
jgi:L-arabinokinase